VIGAAGGDGTGEDREKREGEENAQGGPALSCETCE
jgi:hypothetical protein